MQTYLITFSLLILGLCFMIFTFLLIFLYFAGHVRSQESPAAEEAAAPSTASLLSTLIPSPTAAPIADAVTDVVSDKAGVEAQAVADAADDDNVEAQISNLLAGGVGDVEPKLAEETKTDSDDLSAKSVLEKFAVKEEEAGEEEEEQPSEKALDEKIDTLESAKVREAALDDKLSIELRSIVQQIQVRNIIINTIITNIKLKEMQQEVAAALQEGGGGDIM